MYQFCAFDSIDFLKAEHIADLHLSLMGNIYHQECDSFMVVNFFSFVSVCDV